MCAKGVKKITPFYLYPNKNNKAVTNVYCLVKNHKNHLIFLLHLL